MPLLVPLFLGPLRAERAVPVFRGDPINGQAKCTAPMGKRALPAEGTAVALRDEVAIESLAAP